MSAAEKFTGLHIFAYSLRHAKNILVRKHQTYFTVLIYCIEKQFQYNISNWGEHSIQMQIKFS
jgi:hypothetical protein